MISFSYISSVISTPSAVVHVETYYCESSVSHSHWNQPVFGKLFSIIRLTYIAETLDGWRWNKLALATYYDILYVSRLFDMRDSGGFPTCHSVLSISVSMTLADCLYMRQYCSLFFPINQLINHSDSFIYSYLLLFRSLFRYKSICLYHLHSCSPTEVNTTAVHSP